MKVIPIKILGVYAGNLWNVVDNDGNYVARVSYIGNKLAAVHGRVPKGAAGFIERSIEEDSIRRLEEFWRG